MLPFGQTVKKRLVHEGYEKEAEEKHDEVRQNAACSANLLKPVEFVGFIGSITCTSYAVCTVAQAALNMMTSSAPFLAVHSVTRHPEEMVRKCSVLAHHSVEN